MVEGNELRFCDFTETSPKREEKRKLLQRLYNMYHNKIYTVGRCNGFYGVGYYSFDGEGYITHWVNRGLDDGIRELKTMLKDRV